LIEFEAILQNYNFVASNLIKRREIMAYNLGIPHISRRLSAPKSYDTLLNSHLLSKDPNHAAVQLLNWQRLDGEFRFEVGHNKNDAPVVFAPVVARGGQKLEEYFAHQDDLSLAPADQAFRLTISAASGYQLILQYPERMRGDRIALIDAIMQQAALLRKIGGAEIEQPEGRLETVPGLNTIAWVGAPLHAHLA
jgi:hypothetical protein